MDLDGQGIYRYHLWRDAWLRGQQSHAISLLLHHGLLRAVQRTAPMQRSVSWGGVPAHLDPSDELLYQAASMTCCFLHQNLRHHD